MSSTIEAKVRFFARLFVVWMKVHGEIAHSAHFFVVWTKVLGKIAHNGASKPICAQNCAFAAD